MCDYYGRAGINLPLGCWQQALTTIRRTGFAYLLLKWLCRLTSREQDQLRAGIDATELVPYSLHSWEYLFLDAEGDFADCLARMEMVLDAAERLGVRDITLHPPVILDATVSFEDRQAKFAYFLCLLRSRLAERGLS